MEPLRSERVGVNLSAADKARLKRAADAEDRTPAALAARFVRRGLDEWYRGLEAGEAGREHPQLLAG